MSKKKEPTQEPSVSINDFMEQVQRGFKLFGPKIKEERLSVLFMTNINAPDHPGCVYSSVLGTTQDIINMCMSILTEICEHNPAPFNDPIEFLNNVLIPSYLGATIARKSEDI